MEFKTIMTHDVVRTSLAQTKTRPADINTKTKQLKTIYLQNQFFKWGHGDFRRLIRLQVLVIEISTIESITMTWPRAARATTALTGRCLRDPFYLVLGNACNNICS